MPAGLSSKMTVLSAKAIFVPPRPMLIAPTPSRMTPLASVEPAQVHSNNQHPTLAIRGMFMGSSVPEIR
jgi:hypothetical protein